MNIMTMDEFAEVYIATRSWEIGAVDAATTWTVALAITEVAATDED